MELTLTLPYPPSDNQRQYTSRDGTFRLRVPVREFRRQVGKAVQVWKSEHPMLTRYLPFATAVEVLVTVAPPDHRRRDMLNLAKCTMDALKYAAVYVDDSLITEAHFTRQPPVPGGQVQVTIRA